jgi:hypothetical protein
MIEWFRKKFNSDKYEIVSSDVPFSTITRWYLYDTDLVKNKNEIAEMLGLTPISEEGENKEQEDSDNRIKQMAPLMPYLEAMSELSANAISSMHIKELLSKVPEDKQEQALEELESMGTVYKAIALSTLIGSFSIALNLGMISHDTFDTRFMELGDMEDDDE